MRYHASCKTLKLKNMHSMKTVNCSLLAFIMFIPLLNQAQTYYSYGFESTLASAGWTVQYSSGSNWARSLVAKYTGNYSARHNYNAVTNQDAWLITPAINLSGSTSPILSYWDYVVYAADAGVHDVLVSTDYIAGQNPWDPAYTWDTVCSMIGTSFWKNAANIPLSDYKTANVFIAWHYVALDGAIWYIDDISVHESGAAPVNDSCQNAISIDGPYPETVTDSNTWATFDCPESLSFWNGMWYEIKLPNSCNFLELTISSLQTDLSTAGIILSSDCSCSEGSYIYADSSEFTSDTSIYMQFQTLTGPAVVYLPLYLEPLQKFSFTVNVTEVPCSPPANLDIDTFAEKSVTVSWTPGGCEAEWEAEFGLYGFIPTGIADSTLIISTPWVLSGLEAGQCYEIYLRSVCGANEYSDWSQPLAFCTNCPGTVDSLQYLYNYEPPAWPPNCWSVTSVSDSTWTYGYSLNPPVTHLTFCNWHPTQAQNEWLVTPPIDLSQVTHPALSFNWMTSYLWNVDYDNANLDLLISTDGGTTWLTDTLFSEDKIGLFADWEWYFSQVDLAAYSSQSQVKFAFVYTGTDGDAFAIDNFMVGPANDSTSWTGATNTDWFNVGNWDNFVPFEEASVHIPEVTGANGLAPVTNNVVHCFDITLQPDANLTVQEGTAIHVLKGLVPPTDQIPGAAGRSKPEKGQLHVRQVMDSGRETEIMHGEGSRSGKNFYKTLDRPAITMQKESERNK